MSNLSCIIYSSVSVCNIQGRLAELLSTIRMQREKGELKDAERYTMNPAAQDEIKQVICLRMIAKRKIRYVRLFFHHCLIAKKNEVSFDRLLAKQQVSNMST